MKPCVVAEDPSSNLGMTGKNLNPNLKMSLIFKAEEGSLSVPCSALKETVQYPGEVFSLGRCSRSLPVCVFQMGALWISSVFAFSEKFSYDFPLRILQQMQFLCRFPLSSPQALCALF